MQLASLGGGDERGVSFIYPRESCPMSLPLSYLTHRYTHHHHLPASFFFLPFSFVCERRPLLRLYASNQSHTKLKSMSAKFLIPLGSMSEPFSSIVRTGKKKTLSPTTYHILLDELGASQCHMYSFLIPPPLVIYNVASL